MQFTFKIFIGTIVILTETIVPAVSVKIPTVQFFPGF